MVYICGDVHGSHDLQKIKLFEENNRDSLTESDYLIVAGDMGILWSDDVNSEELRLKEFYNSQKFTTLFIDGNHENFNRLDVLPLVPMFGNYVGKVSHKIFHLKRGIVYNIDGKSIFTFGGGFSIDKLWREENVSWWARELPSREEYERGFNSLAFVNSKVDAIITHSCPLSIFDEMASMYDLSHKIGIEETELRRYLDIISKEVSFDNWYYGHFHIDADFGNGKFHALYNKRVLTLP